ncbi:MAG: hypothetical protein Q9178_008035 [Gyalolechia marmorata]
MDRKLNVIGLISGGKDSFYSLLHCLANGHRILALANLYPQAPTAKNGEKNEESDLNSFMYQTVGHTLIPLYEEILSLPLYRQEIRGTAVNQAKEYSTRHIDKRPSTALDEVDDDDETESMMTLLGRIKADHPEADAVCSGAILSTYQRTRIESVALRMHLVPLAYLWQYPELPTPVPRKEGLLADMAAVGFDARIVKVASGGLDEDLLWENVCAEATRKKLGQAMKRFGGSVLGEGGEFETVVIDGPADFFIGAIEVGAEQRKTMRGGGGEASLSFTGGTSRKRERQRADDTGWLEKLQIPSQLDEAFEELLEALDLGKVSKPGSGLRPPIVQPSAMQYHWKDEYHICPGRWTTKISNLSASYVRDSTQGQMERINQILVSLLENEVHGSTDDIVFSTILLRSMDDFQAVNQKYAALFDSRPNPPARATIACGNSLPPGVNVMISVVLDTGPKVARQHLHVQSLSYWAPANIGPYSQATSVRLGTKDASAVVYVAGQIPLVPSSMEIVTRVRRSEASRSEQELATFRLQTTLALQHLWRIGKAMNVSWWVGAIAFVVAGKDDIQEKAHATALAWAEIHAQERRRVLTEGLTRTHDTGFDVWNEQCIDGGSFMTGRENDVLPDFSCLSVVPKDEAATPDGHPVVSPFFAIEVAQLPRSSQIEWQGVGVSQVAVKFLETIWEHGNSITACSMASGEKVFGFIGIRLSSTEEEMYNQIGTTISTLLKRCKVPTTAKEHRTLYTAHEIDMKRVEAQIIPCRSVWNLQGEELSAALVVDLTLDMPKGIKRPVPSIDDAPLSKTHPSDDPSSFSTSPQQGPRRQLGIPSVAPRADGHCDLKSSAAKDSSCRSDIALKEFVDSDSRKRRKDSTTPSDSGTEADNESGPLLKSLPAPPAKLRKGLKNGSAVGTPSPLLTPSYLDDEKRREVFEASLKRRASLQSHTSTDEETLAIRDKFRKKRRAELIRRLTETVLLLCIGGIACWRTILLPIRKRITHALLVICGTYTLYPFRLFNHHRRLATNARPSRRFIQIPAAFDPATLLYPVLLPVFAAASLLSPDDLFMTLNLCLGIGSMPRTIVPLQDSFSGHTSVQWMFSGNANKDRLILKVRTAIPQLPMQLDGHGSPSLGEIKRERSCTLPLNTGRRRPNNPGPQKDMKSQNATSFFHKMKDFRSFTKAQATMAKWLFALYTYAVVTLVIAFPVRVYIAKCALHNEEPVGWALGYLFSDLHSFRTIVMALELDQWIRLPNDDLAMREVHGWAEEVRWRHIGAANTRLLICLYYIITICVGLAVVLRLSSFADVDTRRKVFHGMMVVMCLPTIFVDPAFVAVALSAGLAVFLLLDLFRASQLPPLSRPLTHFLAPYVDGRDHRGPVIVSHIFLLIGCSIPLWLSLASVERSTEPAWPGWEVPRRDLSMISGVVCVGMGDAAASLIGRRYGRRRWCWSGGKSIEGSAAFAGAVTLGLGFARLWLLYGGWDGDSGDSWPLFLCKVVVAASGASLTEAVLTGGNDNVIVPIILWLLVRGLGV